MRVRAVAAALLLTVVLGGCDTSTDEPGALPDGTIRVVSYDFTENQILAEIYAAALRRAGLDVVVQHGVGTREVVLPALEQGVVDLVVDYLGTAAEFYRPDADSARRDVDDLHADLARTLAPRGMTVLAAAAAQDQNGFVVLARVAAEEGITRLSDLTGRAADLTFGGPPECPDRQHCLIGLRAVYGIEFGTVLSMPSRAATVDTLLAGGIDVGMLETTDPHLTDRSLLLLEDDRGMQPYENLVPIVATEVLEEAGDVLATTVDDVSARLTTAVLVELNRAVALGGRTPAEAAAQWWAAA